MPSTQQAGFEIIVDSPCELSEISHVDGECVNLDVFDDHMCYVYVTFFHPEEEFLFYT